MKRLSIALALLGLILILGLIAWFGAPEVLAALGRVSAAEFALIVAWQGLLFLILGLSWHALAPSDPNRRPFVLIWARMVRDASATCLPFSQLGGFVLGARAASLHGMRWQSATASIIVDVTAEFLAQIAFAALGLIILLAHAPGHELGWPAALGLALLAACGAGFVVAQNGAGRLFAALGTRIAGDRLAGARGHVEDMEAELRAMYGATGRLATGFALHLLGWIGTGAAGWITLRVLGVEISFTEALAIEALLAVIAAMAFLVPLSAGVQEAGYIGLGALFGVPAEMALATSLIRRARDLVIGVPILLIWQLVEVRRLRE
jgi:putative membrane protein